MMKNIWSICCSYFREKVEILFYMVFCAVVLGALFLVGFGIRGCVRHLSAAQMKYNNEHYSYIVRDPRTLNDAQPKWITLRYEEVSFGNYSIIFVLDGKEYSTKEYIGVKIYEKN